MSGQASRAFVLILRRLLVVLVSLIVASAMVFGIVQILPGDVAQMVLGADATPASLAAMREKLGLNEPLVTRYFQWVAGVLRADFGTSLSIPGFAVSDLILTRLPNSLLLAAMAMMIILPVALTLGTLCALRPHSLFDRIVSIASMVTISLPEFASAIFLIILFSKLIPVLPSMSAIDRHVDLSMQLEMFVLPALALSLITTGYILRMVRFSVLNVAASDQVKAAALSGVPRSVVLVHYILRNSLIPTVTIIAMNMGWLIGGLVVVETVFAFPGLGTLLLHAVTQRDVPLIQGVALCSVVVYLLMNLTADVIAVMLNPRLRPQ